MKLQTLVQITAPPFQVDARSRVLVVGSCFAEVLGARLSAVMQYLGGQGGDGADLQQGGVSSGSDADGGGSGGGVVHSNPVGVVYNPMSVSRAIEIFRTKPKFNKNDLIQHDGLWHHMDFHGKFSADTPQKTLETINPKTTPQPDDLADNSDEKIDTIVLTLGTAFVYEMNGKTVANCHKIPEKKFTRRKINVQQATTALQKIAEIYPTANIIITLSPIRHLRDGLADNSLSKATLRVAIDDFCAQAPQQRVYFPAYEILLDELRDYRFTAEDMCHPTAQTQAYIWQKFAQTFLTQELQTADTAAQKQQKRELHRPLR